MRFLKNRKKPAEKTRAKKGKPRRDGMPHGFPRFKSRKQGVGRFRIPGCYTKVFNVAIKLPRIGKVRLKEKGYLPTEGVRFLWATVSEKAGRWFASLQV